MITAAKDLHRRSPVVEFSHKSFVTRPFRPLLACAVFGLTLASAFAATTAEGANAVGAIAGSAGVSATGAATYTIPISLPPGTNGMQPSLALVYNSQSGEGAAGYGWTLAGLSAITRCPWTIEDNGMAQAVQFAASPAASDDFCLDGQHLILTGGNGFSNGSSYSTEIQNFSKINSYTDSTATNGPSWFQIKTKDGRVYDYGNTADSKIYAQGTYSSGAGIVRAWALASVTDTNGNYYSVTYQNNYSTTGDYWPLSIAYGGNSTTGTTPLHTVTFSWTPRSDNSVQATYLVGSLITQTQLLNKVIVSYNGATTFKYTLSYQTDTANFRNQLASVQECDGSGNCLPATTVQWQNGAAGWGGDHDTGVSVPDIAHATAGHLMDVDGDGIMDFVYPDSPSPTGTGHWMVMFGQPSGGLGPKTDTGISYASPYYQYALTVDYDGDGRMDLLVPTASGWQLLKGTGNQTGTIFATSTPSFPSLNANNSVTNLPIYQGNVWAVDFYGRGLTDLAYSDGTNVYVAQNGVAYTSYTKAPIAFTSQKTTELRSTTSNFIDTPVAFDDSGRPGAVIYFDTVNTCNSDGCTPPPDTIGYSFLQASGAIGSPQFAYMGRTTLHEMVPEPINATGGGLTDVLYTAGYNYSVGVSASSNTTPVSISTSISDAGISDDVIADYYGDGRQEALVYDASSSTHYSLIRLNYSLSSQAFVIPTPPSVATAAPSGYVTGSMRVGNIEANGFDDLVYAFKVSSGQYNWHYKLHNGAPDLVTSVTDGFGNAATFTYSSLASGGPVYARHNSAQYPIKDVQLPMQVVSSYGVSDGIGGTYTLNYSYTDALFDSQGHGFLGFATRTVTDNNRGIIETTTYSQAFPLTGMVLSDIVTRQIDTQILSDTENTGPEALGYASPTLCTTVCYPFFDSSTTTTYNYTSELNGAVQQEMSQSTATLSQTSFDAYGNLTNQQGNTADVAKGVTFYSSSDTQFAPANTSSYCVSLPQSTNVQRDFVTIGSSSPSRTASTVATDLDTTHCRLNSQTVQDGEDSTSLTDQYKYDAYGNVSEVDVSGSEINPSPRTTTYDFTGGNQEFPTTTTYVVSTSPSVSLVTHAAWNYALGFKTSDTDANGKTTTYTPDGFGRVNLITRPDGTQTQYSYNLCSSPTQGITCPASGVYEVTTTEIPNPNVQPVNPAVTTGYTAYDMKGRPVETGTRLLGGVMSLVDTTYDNMGHVLSVTRPYFSGGQQYKSTYTYDVVVNRLTGVSQPENASCAPTCTDTTTLSYGVATGIGFGVTALHTVSAGSQQTTKYSDALGEVVQMLDANNGSTIYKYDAFGNLTYTTDADLNVTHMTYDGLGHKITMTDPDMGQWSYQVDALGEIVCQTDANNQSIIMGYDGVGRLASKKTTTPGGTCTPDSAHVSANDSWSYDNTGALGLPASVGDSVSGFQRTYGYDSLDRPNSVATTIPGNPTPYTVSTDYDDFSRVAHVVYPVSVTPTASNSAPTAVATATPNSLVVGSGAVTLDGSGSYPTTPPLQYQWSESPSSPPITLNNLDTATAHTSFVPALPGLYSIQLQVIDSNSAISAPASVSISVYPAAPPAPTAASPSYNGNVALTWSNQAGVTSYEVLYSTNGTTFTLAQTVNTTAGATTTNYTVTGLAENTYYFALVACAGSLCGAQGPNSSPITMILPPGRPTGLNANPPGTVASPNSSGNYTLKWTAPTVGPVTSYQVYLASNNSPVGSPTSNTSLPISGMADGTYSYYVVASNGAGPGPGSAQTTVVVLHVPGKPGQAVASPNAGNPRDPFTLTWTKPTTGGAVAYYIVMGNTSVQYTTTSASLKMPSDGVYQYYVQGCNNAGCGVDSASATVTVTGIAGGGGCPTCSQTAPTGGGTTSAPTSGTTSAPASSSGVPMAVILPMDLPEQSQPQLPIPAAPRSGALSVLAHERQTLLAGQPRQPLEAVLQARADQRSQARQRVLLPPASGRDVTAWNASEMQRLSLDPKAPAFAPPAYIAYGGARIAPATSTAYQFEVTYSYDFSSGGLEAVSDTSTGFIYWRIAGGAAPVDAFGNLLGYIDGNNVSTVSSFDGVTGTVTGIGTGIGQSSAVQQLVYTWDGFGNLTQRCDVNRSMYENFRYNDKLNRLTGSTVYTQATVNQQNNPLCGGGTAGASIGASYSNTGNIQSLSNSGNTAVGGTYAYDPNHPHAVSTVTNIPGTNTYDANGNMVCRFGTWNGTSCSSGTQITWNADNLPTCIDKTGGTCAPGGNSASQFSYGPDNQRYSQTATDSSGNVTSTTYIGSLFEVVSTSSDTQYRHNIMAAGGIVAVHTIHQSGTVETDYIHSDHLGSGDVITDDTGNIATDPVTGEQQIMSFDAFGLRRDPNNWAYDLTTTQIGGLKAKTDKGYTAQEQLDNVDLVHMNGRVYDPSIGRMVSADPTVPNPLYSQAFNRYAYVYNNPLSATDPSGFYTYPAVNFLPPNTSTLPFPNNQVPYGYGTEGFSDLASNPAGIPCPACGSTPPDVAANLAPTTFSQVTAPNTASPINSTVSVPSTSLSNVGGIGSVDSNNSNANGTGGSGDSNAQTTKSPTIANALNGSQCGGCTIEAFVTVAGPGALDGMAESTPKSPTPVMPKSNGTNARAVINRDPLRNIPHIPGMAGGQLRPQPVTGTAPTNTPQPDQVSTPGKFILGGEIGLGAPAALGGAIWRASSIIRSLNAAAAAANAGEALESGELLFAIAELSDIGMGSLVGAAVLGGPALVIGAGLGLAAYGAYELYEHEKGPPAGP